MVALMTPIDSRGPAETLLDLGQGDVFNTRLAHDVADRATPAGIGRVCPLVDVNGVPVLGHASRGAVAGAIAALALFFIAWFTR